MSGDDPYSVTGQFLGETVPDVKDMTIVNIVVTLSKTKNKSHKATMGTLNVYLCSVTETETLEYGKEVLSVPIVSGGEEYDSDGNVINTYSPIAKGTYRNVKKQKAGESGNKKLHDEYHGGKDNIILRIYDGFLIHQGNDRVNQEGAYSEGCISITANETYDKKTGSSNVKSNYSQFKEYVNLGGIINVIIK